jgi:hypothetical protein
MNDGKEWEVEEVLDSRRTKRRGGVKLEYKVRWANTLLAELSWEPAVNLQNVHKVV